MILAASRKKAVCCSLKVDADAIYEAIQELYEDLGGITLEDRMDIKGFKSLLKEYNDGKRELAKSMQDSIPVPPLPEAALTRDCSYYEELCKGDMSCRQ